MSNKNKNLIYLDVCYFNRPYDDQVHPLVRLETESKLLIQEEVANGNLDRKRQIALWEGLSTKVITFKSDILSQTKQLMPKGIKSKDDVRIACAISAQADYFITTDKRLLNKTVAEIPIVSPIDFIRGYFHES